MFSRTRAGVLVFIPVLVVVSTLLAGCSRAVDSPTPGYSAIVDDSAPLTATQATEVRTAGHALMTSIANKLATRTATPDDDGTEAWEPCVAKSFYLRPRAKFNGVSYVADLPFDTSATLTAKDARAALDDLPIQWNLVQQGGTSDVFGVDVTGAPEQVRATLTSPCYFLRDTPDGSDHVSAADTVAITGFLRRPLVL